MWYGGCTGSTSDGRDSVEAVWKYDRGWAANETTLELEFDVVLHVCMGKGGNVVVQ